MRAATASYFIPVAFWTCATTMSAALAKTLFRNLSGLAAQNRSVAVRAATSASADWPVATHPQP